MENVVVQQEIGKIRPFISIKNFPVSFFTSVMGIGGLSIAYQRYADILDLPFIGLALLAIAYIFFIGISLTYGYKMLFYRKDAVAEFDHPVKTNYFAAISISLLSAGDRDFRLPALDSVRALGMGTILQLTLFLVDRISLDHAGS